MGTADVQGNWKVACDKVLKEMEHAIKIYGKQEILYAKLKNDKPIEEKDKDMKPAMDGVNEALPQKVVTSQITPKNLWI